MDHTTNVSNAVVATTITICVIATGMINGSILKALPKDNSKDTGLLSRIR
jgi:hypothetical protein